MSLRLLDLVENCVTLFFDFETMVHDELKYQFWSGVSIIVYIIRCYRERMWLNWVVRGVITQKFEDASEMYVSYHMEMYVPHKDCFLMF